MDRVASEAGYREQELRRRLLESRRRDQPTERRTSRSRSRSPPLRRRSSPPNAALTGNAPRPHTDRWVPPPREDHDHYSSRYPPDTDYRERGPPRARYFEAGSSSAPRPNENGTEYGAAQWRRLPKDSLNSNGDFGSGDFLGSRDQQRKQSTLSIWPPSPTSPYVDSEEEREKARQDRRKRDKERRKDRHDKSDRSRHGRSSRHESSREKVRHRSSRTDDDTDRHGRHSSRKHRHRHRSVSSDSGSDRRRSHAKPSAGRHTSSGMHNDSSRKRRRSVSSSDSDSSDVSQAHDTSKARSSSRRTRSPTADKKTLVSSDSDVEVGPSLPKAADGRVIDPRSYGGALLPGEGTAMASYVQDGKRIPRRGEIGLTSDQIEHFEKAGYVMSGSRHARMNAVRMRKENQVISAEEKRSMLRLQADQKQKKEREIVSQFKELVDTLQPPSASSSAKKAT